MFYPNKLRERKAVKPLAKKNRKYSNPRENNDNMIKNRKPLSSKKKVNIKPKTSPSKEKANIKPKKLPTEKTKKAKDLSK